MMHLPEPRRFGGASVTDALAALAHRARDADPLAQPGARLQLQRAVEAWLNRDPAASWADVSAQAQDAATYRLLQEALARSIDAPVDSGATVIARAFAIPIVFVAASSRPARLAGSIGDVNALQALFIRSNALGPTQNFGLSNALCSLQALERLSPIALFRSTRSMEPSAVSTMLPPEDIVLAPNQEQTHLRFIVGAGLTASNAPGFTETAANVGGWARECAKLIGDRLQTSGVQLLVLPRPPRDMIMAAHAGRHSQLETALHLFASNAVRRFRSAVGEPVVIVSAHADGDVRVTLSSVFAPELTEGFRWPLHPLDDLVTLETTIVELFGQMRVNDIRVMPRVLEPERTSGVLLHPRTEEWESLCARPASH